MDGGWGRELGSRDEVFFACVRGLAGWRCGYKVGRLFWVERQAGKGRKERGAADEKVLRQRFGQHVCVVSI